MHITSLLLGRWYLWH